MSFWLATLNPGVKTRRRGKRRKLSAWQRAVKRHGGVMQAVKAMRKSKRKRRAGGRRRRNPFLTTALSSGGAHVQMNARRTKRRRKIRTRRSVVSRRFLRSRSRKVTRRLKMARKTRRSRRRMPLRGSKGRFLKGSRRTRRAGRRRTRRNPVLPISWNPSRRRRRTRRARRNPLFLSARGFSPRKRRGYRRLHMRRHAPRHWHNNPRRRRSYRRNPVLPISWNPAIALGKAPQQIMARVQSFINVQFWTETGLPAAAGFFGSKATGGFLSDMLAKAWVPPAKAQPFVRITLDAVGGAGLALLADRFVGRKQGDAIWMGTVVNVAHALLKQLIGGTAIAKAIGLDGLGDDLSERMKRAIAARVQNSLNGSGLGSYLRTTNVNGGMGEFVTEGALRMDSSYAPAPGGSLKEYDPTYQGNDF